jgi:hypothetical protein
MDLKNKIDDDSDETDPHLIRSPMYLANTRLDSCHTMNVLSHFMSQPKQTHSTTKKHVLIYMQDMA